MLGFHVQMSHPSLYQAWKIAQDVFGGFFDLFEKPLHSASEDKRIGDSSSSGSR